MNGGQRVGIGEEPEDAGEGEEGGEGPWGWGPGDRRPSGGRGRARTRVCSARQQREEGLQVGRGAGCAPRRPCGEGRPTAARPALGSWPGPARQAQALRVPPARDRSAGPRRRVSCLRGASVGAGAAAGARDARGPAGALGAKELGARRLAASSSCRAGPRRPAAAAGAKRRPGRRPGPQRARSGSGSCGLQLPARPQGWQRQLHYRRRPGVRRPRRRRPRTAPDTRRRVLPAEPWSPAAVGAASDLHKGAVAKGQGSWDRRARPETPTGSARRLGTRQAALRRDPRKP